MTQKETVLHLLRINKRVTLGMLFDAGCGYCGRNRVSDLKKEGYVIGHEYGKRPSDNAYFLISEPLPVQVDQAGQRSFA